MFAPTLKPLGDPEWHHVAWFAAAHLKELCAHIHFGLQSRPQRILCRPALRIMGKQGMSDVSGLPSHSRNWYLTLRWAYTKCLNSVS